MNYKVKYANQPEVQVPISYRPNIAFLQIVDNQWHREIVARQGRQQSHLNSWNYTQVPIRRDYSEHYHYRKKYIHFSGR